MRRKSNEKSSSKFILAVLSILCIALIVISFLNDSVTSPIRQLTGMVITPVQTGINSLGNWVSGFTSNLSDAASLREENQMLQEKVDTLTAENSQLVLDKEELMRLRELYELDEQYSEY